MDLHCELPIGRLVVVTFDTLQRNVRLVRRQQCVSGSRWRSRSRQRKRNATIDQIEQRFGFSVGRPALQLFAQLPRRTSAVSVLEQRDREVEAIVGIIRVSSDRFRKVLDRSGMPSAPASATPMLLYTSVNGRRVDKKLNALNAFSKFPR